MMKVFAHRGASAYAPQNTIPAFVKALERGAGGIELDVQLSCDGVPVVIHDFVLDSSTDATGFVHKSSWKELRKADAGIRFSEDFKGTKIPSLEEVLALVPPEVCLNVEIKALSYLKEDTAGVVCDLLKQEKRDRKLIISSFNHPILKQIEERHPGMRLGVLTGSELLDLPGYVEQSGIRAYSIHTAACYVTQELCDTVHSRGWKIMTYTVNEAYQAVLLEEMGVDGVFSDYPDLVAV